MEDVWLVARIEQKKARIRRLLEFIHDQENDYDKGCPLMMIYPFAAREGMSGTWLLQMLRKLTCERVLLQKYGHYKVLGWGYAELKKLN